MFTFIQPIVLSQPGTNFTQIHTEQHKKRNEKFFSIQMVKPQCH